jgi:hypothetical protein
LRSCSSLFGRDKDDDACLTACDENRPRAVFQIVVVGAGRTPALFRMRPDVADAIVVGKVGVQTYRWPNVPFIGIAIRGLVVSSRGTRCGTISQLIEP